MMHFRTYLLRGLAALAIAPTLLAACGGDDDEADSPGAAGGTVAAPTGGDEAYLAVYCKASVTFGAAFVAALKKGAAAANDKDAAKVFVEPFDAYVKELRTAKPPKDVKAAHDQIVAALADVAKDLKDGKDPSQLLDAIEAPDLDEAISARLDAAAKKNPDCVGVGFASE